MGIPDYQTLLLPVLQAAQAGETRVPEVIQAVVEEFGLSEEERSRMQPSGRQRTLANRIHWAKFYLSKAGLLESPGRGRFIASDAGRALLSRRPAGISVETLLTYPAFRDFYGKTTSAADAEVSPSDVVTDASSSGGAAALRAEETPEEQIDAAHAAIRESLRAELLQRVLGQSPAFFERLIVDLLVAMGYGGGRERAARTLGRGGDGGVDGVVDEDRLGLDRVYVQAKRYGAEAVVGRPTVQAFVGSLAGLGATKGVFVTTSSYSAQAIDYVDRIQQRVVLIDGGRLTELLLEYGIGVRTARSIDVKRIDEDFFVEE